MTRPNRSPIVKKTHAYSRDLGQPAKVRNYSVGTVTYASSTGSHDAHSLQFVATPQTREAQFMATSSSPRGSILLGIGYKLSFYSQTNHATEEETQPKLR
jgi:hypothetical protein